MSSQQSEGALTVKLCHSALWEAALLYGLQRNVGKFLLARVFAIIVAAPSQHSFGQALTRLAVLGRRHREASLDPAYRLTFVICTRPVSSACDGYRDQQQ